MDFTVIIPSRNRPVLLRKAIDSVLMQTHPSVEVLVVNDGSDGENEQAYARLAAELSGRVRFLNLEKAKNGHGSSYAVNRGAETASGKYLCFLDDDDFWTDADHLKRAFLSMENAKAEIYFANQNAVLDGIPVVGLLWLNSLKDKLPANAISDTYGCYPIKIDDLMSYSGFSHVNTTILRLSLFENLTGFDETIRYENDLDFYLRIIDAADGIRYFPGVVSLHNAPDPSKALNMSTAVSYLQKMLFRTYVWDKALLFAKSPLIRKSAASYKSDTLKKMALSLAKDGKFRQARHYAGQALPIGFSLKWLAYFIYLGFKSLTSRSS